MMTPNVSLEQQVDSLSQRAVEEKHLESSFTSSSYLFPLTNPPLNPQTLLWHISWLCILLSISIANIQSSNHSMQGGLLKQSIKCLLIFMPKPRAIYFPYSSKNSMFKCIGLSQKVPSDFSVTSYEKTQANFWPPQQN